MLETGRFSTSYELAAAKKINSSYVSRLLRLTLLAPDLMEAILDGRQFVGITLPGLMEPFPMEWDHQHLKTWCFQRTNRTALASDKLYRSKKRSLVPFGWQGCWTFELSLFTWHRKADKVHWDSRTSQI